MSREQKEEKSFTTRKSKKCWKFGNMYQLQKLVQYTNRYAF